MPREFRDDSTELQPPFGFRPLTSTVCGGRRLDCYFLTAPVHLLIPRNTTCNLKLGPPSSQASFMGGKLIKIQARSTSRSASLRCMRACERDIGSIRCRFSCALLVPYASRWFIQTGWVTIKFKPFLVFKMIDRN